MRIKNSIKLVVASALGVAVLSSVSLARQQAPTAPDGSFAALTAEVRLLRLSIEKSAEANAQIQAMTVYLSAQQSRLLQVHARAEATRKDLETIAGEARSFRDSIAGMEAATARGTTNPSERVQTEEMLAERRKTLPRVQAMESEARNRDAQVAAELQVELGRWNDMLARLEQATRR
jgi:hypothetical protein